MPFRIFTSRLTGVLTGKVTKRQSSAEASKRSKGTLKRPAALPSPPLTLQVRDDVIIKPEPVDEDHNHKLVLGSPTSGQQLGLQPLSGHQDVVFPSVERGTTPEGRDLRPSIEQDHLASLRGGNLAYDWVDSDDALANPGETSPEVDAEGNSIDQREESFEPESSPDPPAGHWNIPQDVLDEYEDLKSEVGGSDTWTSTEAHLHRLLGLRGHHPLMPGEWKRDFTGQNLDEILFAPIGSGNDVALRSVKQEMSAQFRATKALGRIFNLPARVSDLRREVDRERVPKLIAALIEKEILRYISWVERDAGLDKLCYASNIGVYRLSDDDVSEAEITGQLNALMSEWADGYRDWYVAMGIKGAPRTLFALVVLQHVVFILTQDASDRDAKSRFLAELDMSRSDGRWLDHALNLAIPVNLARDGMVRVMGNFAEKPVADEDADPDA